jgi:hypothetical protein
MSHLSYTAARKIADEQLYPVGVSYREQIRNQPAAYRLVVEAWRQEKPQLWWDEPGLNINPSLPSYDKTKQARAHTIIGCIQREFRAVDALAKVCLPFFPVRELAEHTASGTISYEIVFDIYVARAYEVLANGRCIMDAILDRLEQVAANPSPVLASVINMHSAPSRADLELYTLVHLSGQAMGAAAEREVIAHLNTLHAKWGASCVAATEVRDEFDDVDAYIITASGRKAAAVSIKTFKACRDLDNEVHKYRVTKGKTRPDFYAGYDYPEQLAAAEGMRTLYYTDPASITAMLVEDHHATLVKE